MRTSNPAIIFRGKTKNFSEAEFRCRCGCGYNVTKRGFVDRLQYARTIAGIPFIINSGSRCADHNEKVGGGSRSWHLRGHAADISLDPQILAQYGCDLTLFEITGKILPGLLLAKFKRIGVHLNMRFIHVDDGKWTKDQKVSIWGG